MLYSTHKSCLNNTKQTIFKIISRQKIGPSDHIYFEVLIFKQTSFIEVHINLLRYPIQNIYTCFKSKCR